MKEYFLAKGMESTFNYFMASCCTGLRPHEWNSATYIENEEDYTLIIKNGKNTNGRSHGEERTIHISKSEIECVYFIKKHMEFMYELTKDCENHEEINHELKKLDERIKKQFQNMNKDIFHERKRRIQRYTARHTAAADFKAAGFTKWEVAALMGHGDKDTAGEHYGRKGSGNTKSPKAIKADEKDVTAVKCRSPDLI